MPLIARAGSTSSYSAARLIRSVTACEVSTSCPRHGDEARPDVDLSQRRPPAVDPVLTRAEQADVASAVVPERALELVDRDAVEERPDDARSDQRDDDCHEDDGQHGHAHRLNGPGLWRVTRRGGGLNLQNRDPLATPRAEPWCGSRTRDAHGRKRAERAPRMSTPPL